MIEMFKNKKIIIIGNGLSGKSAYSLLKKYDYDLSLVNNDKDISNYSYYDIIITSPGIPPNNKIFKLNKLVLSEFELGYLNNIDSSWIAITGTNGKTTIASILKILFKNVVGNIGYPSSKLKKKNINHLLYQK